MLQRSARTRDPHNVILRLCVSWQQARTSTACKLIGCHYLTRHEPEHTRGQHSHDSEERKPGFGLSTKKPPDQIRRPEDYSLQRYCETPSGILQLCVGPSHTREDPHDRDGPEKSSTLCEEELQKQIQCWRYIYMLNDLNWQTIETRDSP